jgi:hypothetical protein
MINKELPKQRTPPNKLLQSILRLIAIIFLGFSVSSALIGAYMLFELNTAWVNNWAMGYGTKHYTLAYMNIFLAVIFALPVYFNKSSPRRVAVIIFFSGLFLPFNRVSAMWGILVFLPILIIAIWAFIVAKKVQ